MTDSELKAAYCKHRSVAPDAFRQHYPNFASDFSTFCAGHAAAQPKWLPIETAPKDTEVLVGPTKRMGICVAMNDSRDGWVTETPSEWVSIYTPTHYMPLPAPPEQKE